ncbi:DUF4271 domain-containing protein [Niabella sp. CC-SYL272]|uniref:DUF4271 domain-containing protein n=1 Tax=Niabella agricola TaxID=2891571 RepID=UPI001F1F8F32|nr:DUF4271 domain-containing protein [Niabella agricola]MCF3111491.1 DUF4271 domain-containing protein [Niabella agricola]
MSHLAAQKKDSIKEPPQATKPAAKPGARKTTTSRTTPKKPAVTKPVQPAAQPVVTGKKTATGRPTQKNSVNQTKITQPAPLSANRKTTVRKDTSSKKNTTAKAPVQTVVKKDTATAKKTVHRLQTGVQRDSVRKVAVAVPAKKDTAKTATALPLPPPAAIDSTRQKAALADSLKKEAQFAAKDRMFRLTRQILDGHPYYAYSKAPVISPYSKRVKQPGEEIYFYTLAGIMLLFAGFKTAFSKYFDDLTTLFFRRTLKQRQLQQQLSQNTLPSFLFNILFVFVAGYYLALMATQLTAGKIPYPFWQLFAFAVVVVSVAYLAKFFLLKLFGWLFKLQHLTDAYIFLIFLVSKILVLFLLPVIVITSLGGTGIKTIIWTLSWLIIGALFLYRFTVALQLVQKSNKVSLFHFFIYIIAFELLPAFVIYKFILHFLTGNSVPLHPI